MSRGRLDTSRLPLPLELELQEQAARSLTGLVAAQRAHSLLLSGSPANGPAAAARWLAILSLGGPTADANELERLAGRVEREAHPDLIVARPEGDSLRVAEIDHAVAQVIHAPFEAAMQVVVIHGAESLSPTNAEAANRLLKVLEEPPGDALFLLLARAAGSVLETIRSRAIHVPFAPPGIAALRSFLAQRSSGGGLDPEAAAVLSRGDFGQALELADAGPALDRLRATSAVLAGILGGNLRPADAAAAFLDRAQAAADHAQEAAEARFAAEREGLPEREAKRLASASADDGHPRRAKRIGRQARARELERSLDQLSALLRDVIAHHAGASSSLGALPAEAESLMGQADAGRLGAHGLEAIAATRHRLSLNTSADTALAAMFVELSMLASGRVVARRALGVPG